MQKMKAIVCTKYGSAEVLQLGERDKPVPKDDEVLIKIYATSVTNSDLFIRGWNLPLRMRLMLRVALGLRRPRVGVIGETFAGEIEQAGPETSRFKVGDRVYGLTGFSLGAYADYKAMKDVDSKRGCLALMPANISFEEATAAAYGGLLALQRLEPMDIQPGQKVLVYGASGTTGVVAVQYAKHRGAEVTGVCGAAHGDFVKSLGADKVLDYQDDEAAAALETYDVVLDAVGKAKKSDLRTALEERTDKKRLVSIDDSALLLDSGRLDRIRELVEIWAIRPLNDRVYPFEEMVEAHRYVETGHKAGNVAVTVNTK